MNKNIFFLAIAGFIALSFSASTAEATKTKCEMSYDLKSWSVFYRTGRGYGTITCDNGQQASVILRSHGGGVSFGKSEILNGHGTFTHVEDIGTLFGGYASSAAHAGAKKHIAADALWNGHVGLTMAGKGKGWDVGFAFSRLKIEPDLEAHTNQMDTQPTFSSTPIGKQHKKAELAAAPKPEPEPDFVERQEKIEEEIDLYFPPD